MTRREFAGLLCCLPAASQNKPSYAEIRKMLDGRNLRIVPFSHVDWAWVNSRAWMVRRHAIVLAEVLDLLRTTPDFRFYVEQWNEQMEPFLDRKPERADEFRQVLQAGKVEACGGVTNQHPGWMESESLVRDMVIGRRLFQEFAPGLNLEVMIHVDVTPGSSQMPQILHKAGYRYYRIHRPDQALTAQGLPLDFIWKGLDGTELLTSRGFGCGFIADDSLPENFASDWEREVETLYKNEIKRQFDPSGQAPVWMPLGCDDARPMRHWHATAAGGHIAERLLPVPDLIRKWNASETSHMSFATPLEVFRELEQNRRQLRVYGGIVDPTMWTYWYGLNGNRGLRLWRTRANDLLVSAERLWSCATSLGENYPQADFARLWRDLLRVYSHAQMWLFEADYESQFARVKTVVAEAGDLRHCAIRAITGRVAVQDRSCVLLFNDLPWDRTEVVPVWAELQDVGATNVTVRDSRGAELRYQVDDVNWYELPGGSKTIRELQLSVEARVPALGYTTVYFEPAAGTLRVPQSQRSSDRIVNGRLSMSFSSNGVEELVDDQTGTRYKGLGNVQYNQINDTGPYHYGPVVKVHGWSEVKVEAITTGPLCSSFRLSGKAGPHTVSTIGHVYPEQRRISFDSVIQSAGGSGHFMTTVGLPGPGRLVSDIHFGVEDRDVTKIVYAGEERRRKNVFYGAHWTSYSNGRSGLTLVGTTGEKGYQFFPEENSLGHFLLMTNPPNQTWERFVTDAREGAGEHRFDYQFLLHAGDWKAGDVVRRAQEACHPIIAVFPEKERLPAQRTLAEERGFMKLSGRGVQLSAFYREGRSFIVRLYESGGEKAQAALALPFHPASIREINFNGAPRLRKIVMKGNSAHIDISPWEIVTLAVEL